MLEMRDQELTVFSSRSVGRKGHRMKLQSCSKKILIMTNWGGDINSSGFMS